MINKMWCEHVDHVYRARIIDLSDGFSTSPNTQKTVCLNGQGRPFCTPNAQ